MSDDTAASAPTPAGDAQRRLLDALAQRYGDTAFSARDAAASIPCALWQSVGVARPDASSVGRWLRARRGPALTGRPNRAGVVQWRVRGPTAPVAALRAAAPAASPPETPLAQQPPLRDPAPPAPPAPSQHAQPAPLPWWHPPAPAAADSGLPAGRWACGAWWSPEPERVP